MSRVKEAELEIDRTRDLMLKLGLEHGAAALSDLLSRAVQDELNVHRFLDELLVLEHQSREERRVRTSLKLTAMPPGNSLADFDWSFQEGIDRRRVETLATCAWLRSHAVALGIRAIELGFSVGFYRFDDLIHDLKNDADVPPTRVKGKKYLRNSLLIIDEVGYRDLNRQESSLFFRLVSLRYQKGSTIITTNKSIKDWPEIFAGDEVMVTALLDRLLHRCHVFNIKGRSYRLRDLEARMK
jgi:DNA replication protein DnaC